MDSVFEDSPWAPWLRLWDNVESLFFDNTYLLLLTFAAVSYAVMRGGLRSVALIAGVFCWMECAALHSFISNSPATKYLVPTISTVTFTWLVLQLSTLYSRRDNGHKGTQSQPCFLPGMTTHKRLFPKKHSFSYSYLLVGIPVGLKGNYSGMISADLPSSSGLSSLVSSEKAWYNVNADDYLSRGTDQHGLRGKLDTFLKSQGVEPSDYPHAYLVTAARFLGYHFNPVSFWFLYTEEKILSAMVLEVNNTFGERRPYLVHRDFDAEEKQLRNSSPDQVAPEARRAKIKNTWAKDFHVSPFNSRKGSYSLLAADPWADNMETFRGINVTINLSSSKGQPKIVARLFSEGSAIFPVDMTALQKTKFLCKWFWVGYATFPRIVKEAALLWFKRKLHVWYRPEPLKDSQGRLAELDEITLEAAFRAYLRHLVENSSSSLIVTYIPSGITNSAEEIFLSPKAKASATGADTLEIKALTPAFYTRFVGYAHDVEGIFCELAESCTLWADKPDLLLKVFVKKPPSPLHAKTLMDFVSFRAIKALRQRPEAISRPLTSAEVPSQPSSQADVKINDIRDFRMSSMDAFILEQDDSKLKIDYRNALVRLFIAEKFFFGFVELLNAVLVIVDLSVAWVVATGFARAMGSFYIGS